MVAELVLLCFSYDFLQIYWLFTFTVEKLNNAICTRKVEYNIHSFFNAQNDTSIKQHILAKHGNMKLEGIDTNKIKKKLDVCTNKLYGMFKKRIASDICK